MPHSTKHTRLGISQEGESDTEFGVTYLALQFDSLQPDLLKQFEQLLTKALKPTSDIFTECLTRGTWAAAPLHLNREQMN